MMKINGLVSVITMAAVSLISGSQAIAPSIAQSVGPTTGPLTPPVIQSGPNAGTTPDLRLPDRPGMSCDRNQFNPEALEIFVMHKVFVVLNWLRSQDIPGRSRVQAMTQMLGYELDDEFFKVLGF